MTSLLLDLFFLKSPDLSDKGHLIPEILQLEHTISSLYRIVTTYIELVPTLSHVSTLFEDAISTQIGNAQKCNQKFATFDDILLSLTSN